MPDKVTDTNRPAAWFPRLITPNRVIILNSARLPLNDGKGNVVASRKLIFAL
jgi:hypothetical protein